MKGGITLSELFMLLLFSHERRTTYYIRDTYEGKFSSFVSVYCRGKRNAGGRQL